MTDFVGKKCDLCGPHVSGDCQLRPEVRLSLVKTLNTRLSLVKTINSHWSMLSILASYWSGSQKPGPGQGLHLLDGCEGGAGQHVQPAQPPGHREHWPGGQLRHISHLITQVLT